jgi:hypothetical protein
VRRNTTGGEAKEAKDANAGLHADLVFDKDPDGDWQTTGIDQALGTSAMKSLIDRINQKSQPGAAASSPD